MATSRLRSTEKKLLQNEFVAQKYQTTIKEYIQKGYLRRVSPGENKAAIGSLVFTAYPRDSDQLVDIKSEYSLIALPNVKGYSISQRRDSPPS